MRPRVPERGVAGTPSHRDGSYLFVPDNPNYEGSALLLFDEHNRDAAGLASLPETEWERHTRPARPPAPTVKRQQTLVRQRQEQGVPEPLPPSQWIAKVNRTTSFSDCPVPLDVVLCTTGKDPAADDSWTLMTTAEDPTAGAVVDRYGLRVGVEERHRHIKCFWDIAGFKSPRLNLVVNQVVFTLLTYTWLQQHLLRQGKRDLNKATLPRLREKLVPVAEHITVFTDQHYARFSTYEYTVMVTAIRATRPPPHCLNRRTGCAAVALDGGMC